MFAHSARLTSLTLSRSSYPRRDTEWHSPQDSAHKTSHHIKAAGSTLQPEQRPRGDPGQTRGRPRPFVKWGVLCPKYIRTANKVCVSIQEQLVSGPLGWSGAWESPVHESVCLEGPNSSACQSSQILSNLSCPASSQGFLGNETLCSSLNLPISPLFTRNLIYFCL